MPGKLFLSLFVVLLGLSCSAANKKTEITMLVVPREPLLVQIAQDISRRYTALLVCYQQKGSRTAIHAWNGKSWVEVSEEAYTRGEFFKSGPSHAVIVETKKGSAPEVMIPDGSWFPDGNRVATTDPRAVIHLLGRYFGFPYSYWMQFGRRYNYDLEAINPALINVYWWHFRGKDILPALEKRDYKADMDKWLSLNSIPVLPEAPVEPAVSKKTPKIMPAAKPAVAQPLDDLFETEKPAAPEMAPLNSAAIKEPAADEPVLDTEIVPETMEVIPAPAAPVEEPELIEEIEQAAPVKINPFSARDIPAATVIRPTP
jgi:hypothetical protein